MQKQEQYRKRSPALFPVQLPVFGPAIQRPMQPAKEKIEPQQYPSRAEDKTLANMSEHIVTELMSDDEEGFFVGHLLNRGIPDHHTLRRAQARHVRVDGVRFPARYHQKHAIRGNRNARMFREFFDGSDQIRMFFVQWLKLIEERIDDQGGDHDQPKKYQNRRKPKIQPPPPRTAPHHGKQDQDQHDSKRDV